uniref:Coilin N-terminal domain-containing protein n=1 Tax=Fundulus heteroclitus TaxID=8078 RepID=A0A3Q2NQM7_FUNHE
MVCFGVMAVHGNKYIRLRLLFDYPPPAAVGCRMCWLLVDLNTCRVVADLESIIREKFEFSRSSILSLFIEECYLPHTESIYVVRDNDNVRNLTFPHRSSKPDMPSSLGVPLRLQRST